MWALKFSLLSFVFLCVLKMSTCAEDPDSHLNQYVIECLAEHGLNIGIFGITNINDLNEQSFEHLKTVAEDKRNCFVACLYRKQGLITSQGQLSERLPFPDPKKKFPTSFADAANACRAEKIFCRLGGCLYELYF